MGSRTTGSILNECYVDELKKKKKNKREPSIPKMIRGQLYRSSRGKKTQENAIDYKCLNEFQSKAKPSNLSHSYALACSQSSQAKQIFTPTYRVNLTSLGLLQPLQLISMIY